MSERIDCLVIGGGPAGLAAAIQLARLRRSCVVVDDDAGRSLWSQVTRNHLGFPDGVSAADLRLLGQEQTVAYGAELRSGRVVRLARDRRRTADGMATGPGFVATIAPPPADAADPSLPGNIERARRERRHGAGLGESATREAIRIDARTVLLATGVVDRFPAFAGRDACVGISLFWCIVCDGYEAIGRRVAVVGDDEEAVSTALGLRRFSEDVVLVTGRTRSRLTRPMADLLAARDIPVHRRRVAEYCQRDGRIERLELLGGERVACDMVFVSAPKRPRTSLARRLGARADDDGYLDVDEAGRTSVPGIYAAGDCVAARPHQVTVAAAMGATAATAVSFDLSGPELRALG